QLFGAVEGTALATGGDLPAAVQPLIVWTEVVLAIQGAWSWPADQRSPGHGAPEPIGRVPATAEEEVAPVAEAQASYQSKVPLQDAQRLARARYVPEVNVVVRATAREHLAVAPPRQFPNVGWVFERREFLAVAQVAELNEVATQDGQPAAVRMEVNEAYRGAWPQVFPCRTGGQFPDGDRSLVRSGEGYQPAIRTERKATSMMAMRHFQNRLAAGQVPNVVMALTPFIVHGQIPAVRTKPGVNGPNPEPG